jgi:Muramidase (flagellum-specific)
MRAQDGSSSHNLFGIKASSNWKGDSARAITSEFRNGEMVKETAEFRSYGSYKDSFHDLVTLLQSNNRYQDVLKSADNPEQFVRELQKSRVCNRPGLRKQDFADSQADDELPKLRCGGRFHHAFIGTRHKV